MAQPECITTAIRKLMSPGRLGQSISLVRLAHTELVAALAANMPNPLVGAAVEIMTLPSQTAQISPKGLNRRSFIGGSDARIIMGDDEPALHRLWREKRGEAEAEDLSGNLVVQLGTATEGLNRRWYQANTGQVLTDVQRQVRHPALRWMAATLDGRVQATGAVFEAKFMLPWSFSEEARSEERRVGRE